MLEQLRSYLKPPVFPGDENRTYTARIVHLVLWSVLLGLSVYSLVATLSSFLEPDWLVTAWLFVLALSGLTIVLMIMLQRGNVRAAALGINFGLWMFMTIAAFFYGGVAAPAYSGYMLVIVCVSLLVGWRWGLVTAAGSALMGVVFLMAAYKGWLPVWQTTSGAIWSAYVAYFFALAMLVALALHTITRASQQTQDAVSERQKTEQALSHSEQRFRAIFDAVNDAIFVQDLNHGRILDVNQTMCEMYGYSADEARQLTIGELSSGVAPYTQQDAAGWWQKTAGGDPQIFEWQAKDRNGRLFWVEVNMRRAAIDGQDRLLVVVRDINDRKLVEETLRREQIVTRQIAEAALMTPNLDEFYQAVHDAIGPLIPASNFYIALYDAASDQFHVPYLADEFDEVWPPYRPGKGLNAFVLRTGEPLLASPAVLAQLQHDGEAMITRRRMVEWLGVPLKTPQGLLGVMAVQNYSGPPRLNETHKNLLVFASVQVAMAIERKRAEERERRFSRGLRAVIDAAQELIGCADLDTLYRRSVELAREKLGLERCGLYLLDDQTQYLIGTYGTDDRGQTTDERTARHPFQSRPEVFSLSNHLWFTFESKLSYWASNHTQFLADTDWNVATPIRNRRRAVGVLYNDTGITHAPLDETQQDLTAVYASLLGSLLELKRAEADLAHERDLLQVLMDNFPDTIYFKDTASRFTRINRAQAQLLGLAAPEEAIGKTDADFFHSSELTQSFLAEEQRLMTTGEPIIDRVEYNPTAEGQPRWLTASKVPLRDAAGQIVGMVGISRDITDRRLMEDRLRESQARFGSAFEFAAVGMALVAPDHRIVQVNQAFCRMLGYAVDEVVGKQFGELTHPDDIALSAEYHRSLFAGEIETYQFEKRYLHRQGRVIWAWLTVSAVRDAAQQPQYAIAQIQDITERKLAEERERRISQDLRAVIVAADQLLACADLDTLYRRAVELAREDLQVERCGLFMLDAQGWLCGTYGTDMHRQTTDERGAHFQPVSLEGFDARSNQLWAVAESEQTYWTAAGQQVVGRGWIATTFIRTRDRVVGVLYNDTAITRAPLDETQQEVLAVYCSLLGSLIELKHAEEALRESEALYRRAIEAAGAVPYYLDYSTESYRFMGEGIQPMTGLAPAEMQPLAWNDLILEANPLGQTLGLPWSEAVRETRAGQVNEWRCDYRIRRRDGNERWITDASIQVLDEQGQPRGAIGILQDITERKQVELALRESEATTRALLDAIPDAFFRFDAQGVLKQYIPSREVAALLPPGGFAGKPYAEVLPPPMVQQLDLNFQQVLEQGELRTYEYPLDIAGETRYFEARLVRMPPNDVLDMVRDVTDRKRAELALQQREAYLRSMLDNFPYLVWLKDVAGRFLAVNQIFARACGQPDVEAVIGKTDLDVWPRELAERYRADDRRVMDSGHKQSVEEIISEHGTELWFETFKSPIFDAHGNVIGTAGFSHDITARRQAEAAIRESEALFRQLAENAPAFIALSDEVGTATYLNGVWREFRGGDLALPLEPWAENIHPDDRYRFLREFRAALQNQRKITTEYRLRRADGQYRWLLDTMVPRYAADEHFAGFIGIAVDITDRRNAEEALRRSEGRLRMLTDNMADCISQLDASQRLIYVSPSAERVYGHSLRSLLGHPLYDLVHPEDGQRLYHQVVMSIELRLASVRLEYRYHHADGHYLWIESEMRLLYDDLGNFTGAVLGSRDISARKQIEAERESLIEELEDKNAELERFTYTVSHDLKSPLITIRGFLGFLEKDAVSGNLDRLRADIARIAEATTRMQRLLDELLELSRVGRMTNPPEEVSFAQIAREAVELVQGRIMARGVQVEIASSLPVVFADRLRLVEALQNLVDNAVKFMGDQPEPRITIGVLGTQRAGMPIFFVQDNGIGIAPEYHERIFGLFNKLDAKSDGTGVGLALVKRIIDLHGGQIWVESDGPGQGATFFFTLPRPATPAQRS